MTIRPDRRGVLTGLAAAVAMAAVPRFAFAQAAGGPHTLPPLPYDPAALEPHIDAQTMALHHGKHHQAYVDNLNKAIAEHDALRTMPLRDLLGRLPELPEGIRTVVRNNGGGHANHSMFWSIMGPKAGGAPTGDVAAAIDRDFGGFDAFRTRFDAAGTGRFGSGWVFVTVDPSSGRLDILSLPNQDTPLMEGRPVLMGNDVWEHAYYLKYQNRRAEYLKAWWNVVDWATVGRRYAAIRKGDAVL